MIADTAPVCSMACTSCYDSTICEVLSTSLNVVSTTRHLRLACLLTIAILLFTRCKVHPPGAQTFALFDKAHLLLNLLLLLLTLLLYTCSAGDNESDSGVGFLGVSGVYWILLGCIPFLKAIIKCLRMTGCGDGTVSCDRCKFREKANNLTFFRRRSSTKVVSLKLCARMDA